MLSVIFSVSVSAETKVLTLSKDNVIVLNSDFNAVSVTKLMEDATKLNANLPSGYPIYLFLYTPGGSIQDGLELIEFLNGLNRPVHTITLFAASMGWQTVQHLGNRYIMKYGTLMSHKARGAFTGEFGGGYSQLDSRYQLWLRRIKMMDEKTVERTKGKQTLKSYTDAYTPELWLQGDEAVALGYADEVVTVKCDSTLTGTRAEVIPAGFVSFSVLYSDCPLKTFPVSVEVQVYTTQGSMSLTNFLSQGGQFGECVEPSGSWLEEATASRPCLLDKNLTLDTIMKLKEQQVSKMNQSLRDNIKYSY